MGTVTNITRVNFSVGDVVHHLLFGYRGVVVDIDYKFQATDEWYEQVARSRPPKDKPWYHVLVHNKEHTTYVAEQNLELDSNAEPIEHPLLEHFFSSYENGKYIQRKSVN